MSAKNKYAKLSREQLEAKLEKLERERYGLVWEDKQEDVASQCETELPVLREDKKREITSNPDLPYNFIIEGDNYHSLYTLNFTHQKKIEVIYIDPPYNTGAKDWKYNNDYVDKDDKFRHSKWISIVLSNASCNI
jgi:adenine-specific DNA-methyltransferase